MTKVQQGSVLGGMLLIVGSCVGAGMLALPILTGIAGFFPSLFALVAAWAFMTFTGLLLVEVLGWFKGQVNLLSMVEEALGKTGRSIAWMTYLFLFYSLLVAYTSKSGEIFSLVLSDYLGLNLPAWVCSVFFTVLFGSIIYLGTRPVDLFNRFLMAGLIITYVGMIGLGIFHVNPSFFLYSEPQYSLIALPFLVVSFGFQNMIPSLTAYLDGNLKRVRTTIIGGSLISLLVYFLWCSLVLGTVPVNGEHGILQSYHTGQEATSALRYALGSEKIVSFALAFGLFAITTSFLAQGLSLSHFLGDGLKSKRANEETYIKRNMWWLCMLALLPPLLFALSRGMTGLFFKALSFAGGICAMILFGILPIAMVWVGRYHKKEKSAYHVAGGKPALLIGLAFTFLVIGCELVHIVSRLFN